MIDWLFQNTFHITITQMIMDYITSVSFYQLYDRKGNLGQLLLF